jgi:hypothetical protein
MQKTLLSNGKWPYPHMPPSKNLGPRVSCADIKESLNPVEMNDEFRHRFFSFPLKNYRLKNRLGVAAMTRMFSPGDSIPRRKNSNWVIR